MEQEQKIQKKVWYDYGNMFYLKDPSVINDNLENAVYVVHVDVFGEFYLVKEQVEFTFDYKLYGLETSLITRIIRTYDKTKSGNIGILLNGLKGTGKTVTAKIICNSLKQPVIIVGKELKGCHLFINSIPQNITVFIDEYEKIFGNSTDMLTIMDGALNSEFRRVFLLTTNELRVDTNLLQRPSRIRYLKKFEDLAPSIVEEIVEDILEHKQFKKECVKFISNLEVITVDIVKAVIQEVNIHEESPEAFQKVFNVKKLTGKFKIEVEVGDEFITFLDKATVNQRPNYSERNIGDYFVVNDEYIGTITDIVSWNTIEVSPMPVDEDDDDEDFDIGKAVETKKKKKEAILTEPTIFKVNEADVSHYNYTFGYGNQQPKKAKTGVKKDSANITSLATRLGAKPSRVNEMDYED